ncbi:MAG: ATP-binding protein [Bacteroidota bacterium]
MQQKIIITGGPGTGKSTIIEALKELGFFCLPEISREITLEARKKGTEQLFLQDPQMFSEMLLEGRENQYHLADRTEEKFVFFDRGIPDIPAYLNYLGVKYDDLFINKSISLRYTKVFLTPPWEKIYRQDTERYEDFEQAMAIHNHLENTYKQLEYTLTDIPLSSTDNRVEFILKTLNLG